MESSCKRTNLEDSARRDVETLKRYILCCKEVAQDSPAVRICLEALSEEMKRIERDEKLRRKFTPQQKLMASEGNSKSDVDDSMSDWQDVAVVASSESAANLSSSPVMVGRNGPDTEMATRSTASSTDVSPLGQALAQIAISELSSAQVLVATPTAAIALALHAVLRSEALGFKCTGIPEVDELDRQQLNAKKGFAAPVRELSKNQFLPDAWDRCANRLVDISSKVLLRYRHPSVGAVTLRVASSLPNESLSSNPSCIIGEILHIRFGPTLVNSQEHKEMNLPLDECINWDSFVSALKASNQNTGILPALHYINLPTLFTKFAQIFDLGEIRHDVIIGYDESLNITSSMHHHHHHEMMDGVSMVYQNSFYNPPINITQIHDQNNATPVPGDFANDQYPVLRSIHDHQQDDSTPGIHGNLMGPHHPIFQRDYDDYDTQNFILPGGLAMQPRFDPFYPPAIGGQHPPSFGRGRRGRGRRGTPGQRPFPSNGDPNPDHQQPPSDLGGNMFM